MWGDVAPVRVTNAGQYRPDIVFLGAGRPRHQRISPVGADYDARLFGNLAAAFGMTANTGHPTVRRGQSGDGEPLPDFRAGFGGGIQEELIEQRPLRRTHLRHAVDRGRIAGQLKLAQIQSNRANYWAVGGEDALQQPPALQARHPRRPDEMG